MCRNDKSGVGPRWKYNNILIWAPTPVDLEERLRVVVQRCERLHVTLSRSKFQIATSLNFAGCIVSSDGVRPDPPRISSLADFPVRRGQTGVRSFLGLCSQLAFYLPDYQHHTVSLRQLTGKRRPFLWLPEPQVEFDKLKTIFIGYLVLATFWVIWKLIVPRYCSRDTLLLSWNAWPLSGQFRSIYSSLRASLISVS